MAEERRHLGQGTHASDCECPPRFSHGTAEPPQIWSNLRSRSGFQRIASKDTAILTDLLSSDLQDIRTLHDSRFTSLGLLAENQEGTQGNSIGLWWETQSNKTDDYTAHYAPVSFQAANQAAGWGNGALQGTLGNTIPYTPLMG